MRPVNLLPAELRSRGAGEGDPRVAYGVVGGLGLLLVMVLVAVFYSNKATTLRDEAAVLRAEAQRQQATVKPVQSFNDFADVTYKRTLLVGGLAKSRFPWDTALENLSKSMPEDITLDTIKTQTSAGDTENANAASMDLDGCAAGWIGISRFMVRMRTMPGVKEVKVANSDSSESSDQSSDSSSGDGGGDAEADAKRKENCGLAPLTFGIKVVYDQQKVDLVGLPKIDSGAAGATGATGATPTPASASTTPGSGG